LGIFDKLFKGVNESFYVHGSGLVRIPTGRLNEIPKVISEFHEAEASRTRLEATMRR